MRHNCASAALACVSSLAAGHLVHCHVQSLHSRWKTAQDELSLLSVLLRREHMPTLKWNPSARQRIRERLKDQSCALATAANCAVSK